MESFLPFNSLAFYNEFIYPIMRMLGIVTERVPKVMRKLIRPTMCWDEGKIIDHDWGSIFLLENCSIIRVFGCPQPPHFLPRFIQERLGIVEFF